MTNEVLEKSSTTAMVVAQNTSITVDETSALQGLVDELRRIDERAELAINTITQAIKTQAVVAKGRALLDLERKLIGFTPENRNDRLLPMLEELGGPDQRTAKTWMAAAMSVEQNAYLTGGEDFLMNFTPTVLTKLGALPESKRADVLETAQKNGKKKVTAKQLDAVAKQPDTIKEKTAEQLELALAEKYRLSQELDALKKDMTVVTDDPEYRRAVTAQEEAVSQALVLEEKLEEAQKEARIYKKQAYEANKKLEDHDDASEEQEAEAKKIRIRKIGSTLPNRIPDVLADIQRFKAEEKDFDPEVREIIVTQIKMLAAFILPNYVSAEED